MAIDWLAWKADTDRQLSDISKRLTALEKNPSPEVMQVLIELRTAVALINEKSNAILNRQDKLRLQIEKLAESVLEEADLAEMLASLKAGETELEEAIRKNEGPQPVQ